MTKMIPTIKIMLDDGAFMPAKAHEWDHGIPGDAGYDVKVLSVETTRIAPIAGSHIGWVRVKIDTGVHVEPTRGFRIMAVPNSRVTKTGFSLPNSPGTIDANYRGSIKFVYLYPFNVWKGIEEVMPQHTGGLLPAIPRRVVVEKSDYENVKSYAESFWAPGTVCGQLIVVPDYDSRLEVVESLTETSRGDGGFGSTDRKETADGK